MILIGGFIISVPLLTSIFQSDADWIWDTCLFRSLPFNSDELFRNTYFYDHDKLNDFIPGLSETLLELTILDSELERTKGEI